jgi:hypothetical protein
MRAAAEPSSDPGALLGWAEVWRTDKHLAGIGRQQLTERGGDGARLVLAVLRRPQPGQCDSKP